MSAERALSRTAYAVDRAFTDERARLLALDYARDAAASPRVDAIDYLPLLGAQHLRSHGVQDPDVFSKLVDVQAALRLDLGRF